MAPRENGLDYDGIVSGPTIYAYAGGNPIGYVDPLGLFGYPEHVSITNTALGNNTSYPGLAYQVANVDFATGSQDPANAFWHAMRDGTNGQTVAQAQALYNQYLTDQVSSCTQEGLARALHAAEDSAARGHKGFQPWSGGLPSAAHAKGDFLPTPAEYQSGVDNAKAIIARYQAQFGCPK